MAYKDDAKAFFETGDKPTQGQFATVFDNLRWNDQEMPLNKVTGLQAALDLKADLNLVRPEEILLAADGSFLMHAKYKLEGISAKNNSSTDVTLTLTFISIGPVVIPWTLDVPAHSTADLDIGKTFWAETIIDVAGITGGSYDVDFPIDLLIFRK